MKKETEEEDVGSEYVKKERFEERLGGSHLRGKQSRGR